MNQKQIVFNIDPFLTYLGDYRISYIKFSYRFYLIVMGAQACTCPNVFSSKIEVPDLKIRSSYGEHTDLPDEKIVQAIFAQSFKENRRTMIAKMIEQDKFFEDEKFVMDSKECSRLSVLFNFSTLKPKIYSLRAQSDITSFIQLNIEFCYLTCVCYFFCKKQIKQAVIPQIIETKYTNPYGAYSIKFFSNGEKHNVLIDDRMPTLADSFIYLRILKGIELWPLIIEKGWCKQIGSYERAKGLSPQDAFEEITGIPAYSYEFKANNRSLINKILTSDAQNYWISLVARTGLEDLKNRQVFYLQGINKQSNEYTIISSYSSYVFDNYEQTRRGEVKVKEQDIFTHFEYAVIGFYKPGYFNTTLKIDCTSREQILIELNVKKKEDVSIRFNQLYAGYLPEQQRQIYDYSPVLIELYEINQKPGSKSQYRILQSCQGCPRSTYGARTVRNNQNSLDFSSKIFESLQGKYLIRFEINWNHEQLLQSGNLVVYSSYKNVDLTQIKNNGQIRTDIYRTILERVLSKDSVTMLNDQNLQIKSFNKLRSTIFSFRNINSSYRTFEVDFKGSQNILIRGGIVDKNKTTIQVQGEQPTVIQILPLNIREGFSFQNFSLQKIQKTSSK